MKEWPQSEQVRLDESEFKTNLGTGNFIFVGSSNDIFAKEIPVRWIVQTLVHCQNHNNHYLFQSKNPERFLQFLPFSVIYKRSILCTTIESNRFYPEIMNHSPHPLKRAEAMEELSKHVPCYVTIEPILDFDLEPMVEMIRRCNPRQVNIGADSRRLNLPEPSKEKVLALIAELEKFTVIERKRNLWRILKG
jgi:DNA repair photolyase